jgi:hypothetical protein
MILKIIFAKKLRFMLKLLLFFCKNAITAFVFEKNANFFADFLRKSQKIVINNIDPRLDFCLERKSLNEIIHFCVYCLF